MYGSILRSEREFIWMVSMQQRASHISCCLECYTTIDILTKSTHQPTCVDFLYMLYMEHQVLAKVFGRSILTADDRLEVSSKRNCCMLNTLNSGI